VTQVTDWADLGLKVSSDAGFNGISRGLLENGGIMVKLGLRDWSDLEPIVLGMEGGWRFRVPWITIERMDLILSAKTSKEQAYQVIKLLQGLVEATRQPENWNKVSE
jgi:hypothetical protein